MMGWKRLPLLLFCLSPAAMAPADEHTVTPRGEYAQIDVRLANETIAALTSGFDWKVEYLEPDVIRLVGDAGDEVYRLRRLAPAAGAARR